MIPPVSRRQHQATVLDPDATPEKPITNVHIDEEPTTLRLQWPRQCDQHKRDLQKRGEKATRSCTHPFSPVTDSWDFGKPPLRVLPLSPVTPARRSRGGRRSCGIMRMSANAPRVFPQWVLYRDPESAHEVPSPLQLSAMTMLQRVDHVSRPYRC